MLKSGTVARVGDDDFIVLLPGTAEAADAAKIAERMLEALRPPFHFDGQEVYTSTSIGISLYPYDGEDAATLLKNADAAMNRAKEKGRNNYQTLYSGYGSQSL
jgi:diguanylate cyclase (GGDEF)-like protein